MGKTLTGNLTTEIAAEEHRPIELYIVCLDDVTLHLTNHDADVSFFDLDGNAQTYTACAISRGDIRTNIDNKIDSVEVQLGNVNLEMSTYIATYEFRGRRMVIWRIYEDYLASSDDYITVFDGLMDSPGIGEQAMKVTVKSRMGTLTKQVPNRMYQIHCNWEFGETECGYDKVTTAITGANVIASSANIIRISGSAYENLADDYYKYGSVEFTAGNNSSESRILTYSSGTFALTGISGMQMGLSYGIDVTAVDDTVTIQQGCDKTPATCEDRFDNLINYGGFPTIPHLLVVR